MSINNIVLSPLQLTDLYSNVLVEMTTYKVPEIQGPRYLGNNEGRILIISNNQEAAFLTDEELQFLTSILTACRLSLSDVAVVNRFIEQHPYQELVDYLQSSKVLLFGIEPVAFGLPMQFPHFQLQEFDKRTYLSAPPLSLIAKDVATKKQLWNSLKQLFNV